MLEISPVCRVAQWGLSAWRHNRPAIFSTAANTGQISLGKGCGGGPPEEEEDEEKEEEEEEDEEEEEEEVEEEEEDE